jgi:hypothetical protein
VSDRAWQKSRPSKAQAKAPGPPMLDQPAGILPHSAKELPAGRDRAFAALGLLRCRNRIGRVLNTIAEPRRTEIAAAIAELEGIDDAGLKQLITELIRREDAELGNAVMRALGLGPTQVPRTILRWIARGVGS